jgi:hypothetical protein
MYTVRWLPEAEEELVAIWTAAASSGAVRVRPRKSITFSITIP